MDDLPSIDELARRLTELGALAEADWDEFKRLEMTSLSSARKEDAMMLLARLPEEDPAKIAMQAGLADLRAWSKARVDAAPATQAPKLIFVSGAPGSGKSSLMSKLAAAHPGMLVATADDFKERFKLMLPRWIGQTQEPAKSDLGRSVYIHRLTALPSWEMVDQALEERKDVAIEMLGLGAAEDERTIRRAMARGYEVEVHHVGCSVEMSLARAAKRHFEQKAAGGEGRWIGLGNAASKQKAILSSFAQLAELLRGSAAKLRLIDNTDMELKTIWRSEDGGKPPTEGFASWSSDPMLWRPGANPAADLCALAKDESGAWMVALVERGSEPFLGSWSLPGGFVRTSSDCHGAFEWGREHAQPAALRRFYEETLCSAQPRDVFFVGKYDGLDRDPRNTESRWVESWVYCARFEGSERLLGGDAARQAKWAPVEDVMSGKIQLAFDHAKILASALEMIQKPAPRPKM